MSISEFLNRTNIEVPLEEYRSAIHTLSGDGFKAWMYLKTEVYQTFYDKTTFQMIFKQIPVQDHKTVKTELMDRDYLIYEPNKQLYYFIADPPNSLCFATIDNLIGIQAENSLGHYYLRRSVILMLNMAGIYGFAINNRFLYIGKSINIGERIEQHLEKIRENDKSNKYQVLRKAKQKGYTIELYVLYKVPLYETNLVKELIGEKEGEYIREYMPPLNYQIPKEDDWNSYTINEYAKFITLEEALRDTQPFTDFKEGWFSVSI